VLVARADENTRQRTAGVERAELLEHPMRTAHGAVDRLVTGTQTPPHQRRPVLPEAFGVVEALLAPDEGDVVVLVVADEVVDQRTHPSGVVHANAVMGIVAGSDAEQHRRDRRGHPQQAAGSTGDGKMASPSTRPAVSATDTSLSEPLESMTGRPSIQHSSAKPRCTSST
jgi:hypothetical protein